MALIGTATGSSPGDDQRAMAEHAGAHICTVDAGTVDAGHVSRITRSDAVVKTVVAASDATT